MCAGSHQTHPVPAHIEQIFILLFLCREQISVSSVWSVSINRLGNHSNFVRRFIMRKVTHLHLVLVLSPMLNISCVLWGSISHKYSFYWQKIIWAATTSAYLNITTFIQQNLLQASPSRRIHFSSAIPQDSTLSFSSLTADRLSKSAVLCTSWPRG